MVTVKSAALVPLTATSGVPDRLKGRSPLLLIVKVRLLVRPSPTLPKSFVPLFAMFVPGGCSMAISGGKTAVPVRLITNGFSSLSLLAIESCALRAPTLTLGANLTIKVVLPLAATLAEGCVVTVKSAALVPLTATCGVPDRLKGRSPLLLIVKVRLLVRPSPTLPKSFVPLLAMLVPAGCSMAISGGKTAVPLSLITNGFSSLSSLAIQS